MRMQPIKIFYIFVPNLGEIQFIRLLKNSFISKTNAYLASY